jgi:hypothetical protein
MKSFIFLTAILTCSMSFAEGFGQSYEGVNSAVCEGENGNLNVNVSDQRLTGVFTDGETTIAFSFEPLAEEYGEEAPVGLMINFLESGFDLFGGIVVSDDFSTFGTLAVVLEKDLIDGASEYDIIYVEAMTGTAISVPMTCVFE